VDTDTLRALFSLLGPVVDLSMYASPQKDGSQEAVVTFSDPAVVVSALHLTGTLLGDLTLIVSILADPIVPVSMGIPPPPTPLGLVPNGSGVGEEPGRTVYVGNLPGAIKELELFQMFSGCGAILAVKLAGGPA
jgi:hypothetical protein